MTMPFLPVTLLTAHPLFMAGALSFLDFNMADCFPPLAYEAQSRPLFGPLVSGLPRVTAWTRCSCHPAIRYHQAPLFNAISEVVFSSLDPRSGSASFSLWARHSRALPSTSLIVYGLQLHAGGGLISDGIFIHDLLQSSQSRAPSDLPLFAARTDSQGSWRSTLGSRR
jgi:hypothetical protein